MKSARHFAGLAALLLSSVALVADQSRSLPAVVSASVPFYPPLARQTRIEATVTVRVSTDGHQVSAVEAEAGPLLLVDAATNNVKTWQFNPHAPTNFEVKFHYRLLNYKCDSQCNCEPEGKESVLLNLPTTVEVSAVIPMICDPAEEVRHKRSWLRRLFHRAHSNG
jgi:hypothetical protein